MSGSVFVELRFWALMLMSFGVPTALYFTLHRRRAISPRTVLLLGLTLVGVAAADTSLLRSLQIEAAKTASTLDDFFASEMAIGLYLVPALFGGVGIDLISSVLRAHLQAAEHRYRSERKDGR